MTFKNAISSIQGIEVGVTVNLATPGNPFNVEAVIMPFMHWSDKPFELRSLYVCDAYAEEQINDAIDTVWSVLNSVINEYKNGA